MSCRKFCRSLIYLVKAKSVKYFDLDLLKYSLSKPDSLIKPAISPQEVSGQFAVFDVTDSEYLKEGMASYSFPFYIQRLPTSMLDASGRPKKAPLHVSLLSQPQPLHLVNKVASAPAKHTTSSPKPELDEEEQCGPLEQPTSSSDKRIDSFSQEKERISTKEAYQNIFSINLKANSNHSSPGHSPPQKLGIFVQNNTKSIPNPICEPIMEEPTLEVQETEEGGNSGPRVEINLTQEGSLKMVTDKSKLHILMSPSEISTTDCNHSKAQAEAARMKLDPGSINRKADPNMYEVDAESNGVIQSIETTPRRHEKHTLSQDGGLSETYGTPHALAMNEDISSKAFTKLSRPQRDSVVRPVPSLRDAKNSFLSGKTASSFLRGSRSAHYSASSKQTGQSGNSAATEQPRTEPPKAPQTPVVPPRNSSTRSGSGSSRRVAVGGTVSATVPASSVEPSAEHTLPRTEVGDRSEQAGGSQNPSWRKLSAPFCKTNNEPTHSSAEGRASDGGRIPRKPVLSICLGDRNNANSQTERKGESLGSSIPKQSKSKESAPKTDISANSIQRLKKMLGSGNSSGALAHHRTTTSMSQRLKGLSQAAATAEQPETNNSTVAVPVVATSPQNHKMEPLFFKKKEQVGLARQTQTVTSGRTKSPAKARPKGGAAKGLGESLHDSRQEDKLKSSSNLSRPASSERSGRPLGLLAAALTKLQSKQSTSKKVEQRVQRATHSKFTEGNKHSQSRRSPPGLRAESPQSRNNMSEVAVAAEMDLSKRRNTAESLGSKKAQKLNLQVHTPSLQNSRKTSIVELFSSGRLTPKRPLTTCNILSMVPKETLRIPENNKIVSIKGDSDSQFEANDESLPRGSLDHAVGFKLRGENKDLPIGLQKTLENADESRRSGVIQEPSSYVLGDQSWFESANSNSANKPAQNGNHQVSVLQRHLTTVVMDNKAEASAKDGFNASKQFPNQTHGVHPRVLTSPKDNKAWAFTKHYNTKPSS